MPVFFILFIATTFTEIWVMIEVGRLIGSLSTIALMVLTALIGAVLLRQQGAATLMRARERMFGGALPAQEMVEGLLLAFGGALLLTPGFITDAVGLLCLIPVTRGRLSLALMKRFSGRTAMTASFKGFQPDLDSAAKDDGKVIDGEFSREKK